MSKTNIKTGDRIEIMPREKAIGKSYVSKVEQIIDEHTMEIHVPIAYGYLVKLPLNTSYSFIFYTDSGMIRSEAEIEKYFVEDGFQMMQIKLITSAEKYQRREFFRFECEIKLRFGAVAEDYDIARDLPKPEMRDAFAKDISAGGMCFLSNHDVELNSRVKCLIPLGTEDFFTLGIVMHRMEMRDMKYKYQYRVMFMDLTSMEKDKIVRFIFTEQRKSLKKGR